MPLAYVYSHTINIGILVYAYAYIYMHTWYAHNFYRPARAGATQTTTKSSLPAVVTELQLRKLQVRDRVEKEDGESCCHPLWQFKYSSPTNNDLV